MTQKWTPGPWVWHAQGDANNYCILNADKTRWIIGFLQNGEIMTPVQEANARLMSASPDMASALRAIFDCYGVGGTAEQFVRNVAPLIDEASVALRKAGAL